MSVEAQGDKRSLAFGQRQGGKGRSPASLESPGDLRDGTSSLKGRDSHSIQSFSISYTSAGDSCRSSVNFWSWELGTFKVINFGEGISTLLGGQPWVLACKIPTLLLSLQSCNQNRFYVRK